MEAHRHIGHLLATRRAMDKGQMNSKSDSHIYDVVIVGAGPAGSTCANALLLNGIDNVALIDRQHFPRDKSCGDGIGPGAVNVIERLGLGEFLAQYKPVARLSVSSPSGTRATGPLPIVDGSVPRGYTIPRKEFDNHLVSAAIKRGVSPFMGQQLKAANFDGNIWNVIIEDISSKLRKSLKCRVLLGADGPRSRVKRILGIPDNPDRRMGVAVRIYASTETPAFQNLQIDFTKDLIPAYGWIFPIDRCNANIGVGIDLDNYKKRRLNIKSLLGQYTRNLKYNYDIESYNSYILPYWNKTKNSDSTQNAALIGDAASMVNPLTGEGIYYGMYAGELLANELAPIFKSGFYDQIPKALDRYTNRFSNKFERHFHLNWVMKEKVGDVNWCNAVVKACSRDSVVLGDLIDMMMGDRSSLTPSTLMRIAVRNILPF